MNDIETNINSYKIFKNKDGSKFRVKYLTETQLSKLLRFLKIKKTPKFTWELLHTGDRDVEYDFKSLERAQEAIKGEIYMRDCIIKQSENDSEWTELK